MPFEITKISAIVVTSSSTLLETLPTASSSVFQDVSLSLPVCRLVCMSPKISEVLESKKVQQSSKNPSLGVTYFQAKVILNT